MKPKQIEDIKLYVGNRIHQIRTDAIPTVTQQDLATALNVEKSTISQYEKGVNLPNIAILLGIAEYFHVTLDYLLALDYDLEWFGSIKNPPQLTEETNFLRYIKSTYKEINSEGKKLLKELASFVRSRYKRDVDKEEAETVEKQIQQAEQQEFLQNYQDQMNELCDEIQELKFALGKFKVLKPGEDPRSLENQELTRKGLTIMSEISYKRIEERIQKKALHYENGQKDS